MKARQGDMVQSGDNIRKRFYFKDVECLIIERLLPLYNGVRSTIVIRNDNGFQVGQECRQGDSLSSMVKEQVCILNLPISAKRGLPFCNRETFD